VLAQDLTSPCAWDQAHVAVRTLNGRLKAVVYIGPPVPASEQRYEQLLSSEHRLRIRFEATRDELEAPDVGAQPRTPTDAKTSSATETVTHRPAVSQAGTPFSQTGPLQKLIEEGL
jgi:hypothetical protein